MTVKKILVDSSFLHALYDRSDKYHEAAKTFALSNTSLQVVPDVVLTEVTHSLNRLVGQHAVVAFLKVIAVSNAQLEPITKADIGRCHQIMEKYPTAKLDFVDCSIMALAERLDIRQICTFDRRDFGIYRPMHAEHLELLP